MISSFTIAVSLACLFAIAICFIARSVSHREQIELRDYLSTHPPISDEEFLRLLEAGIDRDVALRVRRIVSRVTDLDYDQIYPDLHFAFDVC